MLGIPYALFGTEPAGYHLFNLSLHLINTVLVYRLLRVLGAGCVSATLGMGVYGSYPTHFTPLVWIAGIQELAVTLFVLISILAFVAWLRQLSNLWKYVMALVGYSAALLSKETAIFFASVVGRDRLCHASLAPSRRTMEKSRSQPIGLCACLSGLLGGPPR